MIEMKLTYDLLPSRDQQAYVEWAKKAIDTVLQSPGLVEFRAQHNILSSPQVQATSVWQTLADCIRFSESAEWKTLEFELGDFAINITGHATSRTVGRDNPTGPSTGWILPQERARHTLGR